MLIRHLIHRHLLMQSSPEAATPAPVQTDPDTTTPTDAVVVTVETPANNEGDKPDDGAAVEIATEAVVTANVAKNDAENAVIISEENAEQIDEVKTWQQQMQEQQTQLSTGLNRLTETVTMLAEILTATQHQTETNMAPLSPNPSSSNEDAAAPEKMEPADPQEMTPPKRAKTEAKKQGKREGLIWM